jgi:hypothetical protein
MNRIDWDVKFKAYHEANPQIYEAFKAYTFKAIAKQYKRFSAEFILNVIRWETAITGKEQFKINNNYKALYARLFMRDFPQYEGYFETRKRFIN